MKRKIALLLALVMVLSMVPMMSFAASGNTETIIKGGVPRVADDYETPLDKPQNKLIIKEDNYPVEASEDDPVYFQLRIENAKWLKKDNNKREYPVVTDEVYGYEITNRTDKVLDIKLVKSIQEKSPAYEFEIPLFFEVDGTGPVKVTVDSMDSDITGGTYTVANAAKGDTVTTIDDVITFSEKGELDPIRIEENSGGALGVGKHKIKLRLPTNFEWANPKNKDVKPEIKFTHGFTEAEYRTVEKDGKDVKELVSGNIEVIDGPTYDGERDFEFTIEVLEASTTRGVILVENTAIYATSSAKEGDVEMRISGGDVTSETITIAKYSDFDITVKADGDPKELIAGRFEAWTKIANNIADTIENKDDFDDEAHELQKLIIEEEVDDAILNNRRTKVEFPSWVKILGVKVDTTDASISLHAVGEDKRDITKDTIIFGDKYRGESELEFTIDANPDKESKVELTFFVSVKADAEGDIVAEVSGRSGAEGKVVLGKARRAVEMEIKGEAPKIELGKKAQAIPDIIISEIEAEDLMDESDLVINLSNDAEWNDYKVEVIEGDLEIDHDNIDDDAGNLIIPIKKGDASTKPSTIKISNATIDMKRMAADGDINVRVRGTAARKNHIGETNAARGDALDAGFFDQNNVVSAKVAELLHGNYREPGLVTEEVVLTIGSTTMFVDGVSETANAAPYIDAQNRTMLPVSAIGRALGAKVEWNDAARTVLVTKGNTRALLTIGKDVMNVNGMEIPMRSKAVITNERTFVPLKDLGVALGVNVEWDAATRTVTIK